MAIVKILPSNNAAYLLSYAINHGQPGDPRDSQSCPPDPEGAIAEFKAVRDQYDFKDGRREALHIIQSWNEVDSQKLTPKAINEMGRQLVEEYFKGHQFVVATHTDTGKHHNHIVVNVINMETGKAVENKFKHLYELRKINDRLCLEKGLRIPNHEAARRKDRIPQKVQNMVRAGRESWLMDIRNKADVARFLATSFDQYKNYLDAFGITARIEDTNISYFYPGRKKPKRGDNLGKAYDKPGLAKQFQLNDQRFMAKPEVREDLIRAAGQISQNPTRHLHNSNDLLIHSGVHPNELPKDYTAYTKNKRRHQNEIPLSERELSSQIISADEIRKAKRSILDYCKENNIALGVDQQGRTTLKNRSYIVIQDDLAINKRNGTRGNLIDFVAAHHKLTLLQAVAKINGTGTPTTFEKEFGRIKRKYTAFYIPKADQMEYPKSLEHLGRFLKSIGGNHKIANDLLKHQRAEVSKGGVIRLFGDADPGGAYEFIESPDKQWKEKKHGEFRNPFFHRPPRREKLFLYLEPKHYLAEKNAILSDSSHRDGILALMEPNKDAVDNYLGLHPTIKRIEIVSPRHRTIPQQELDFFGVLKKKLHERGIEVSMSSRDKSKSHEGPDL